MMSLHVDDFVKQIKVLQKNQCLSRFSMRKNCANRRKMKTHDFQCTFDERGRPNNDVEFLTVACTN